jgi:hypothetical protein
MPRLDSVLSPACDVVEFRQQYWRGGEGAARSLEWNKRAGSALTSMQRHSDDASRTRAEALFKRREQQKADAPVAMAEYRAGQEAALRRMQELKRLRLAREAESAGKQ